MYNEALEIDLYVVNTSSRMKTPRSALRITNKNNKKTKIWRWSLKR